MSQLYPIPRQTRQAILVANSGQSVFGPFDFLLFGASDLQVRTRADADDEWTLIDESQWSASPTGAGWPSLFTLTLDEGLAASAQIWVKGARLHERQTNVTQGGAIKSTLIEQEFDRQSAILQEVRRDLDGLFAGTSGQLAAASGIANDSQSAAGGTVAEALDGLAENTVRHDVDQGLTAPRKKQARDNIDARRETVVDIFNMGAVPYSGADVTDIINAAVAAANSAGGKEVSLPPGDFVIEGSIVPMSFAPIIGAGRGVTRLICKTNAVYQQVAGSQLYKAGLSNLTLIAASGFEGATVLGLGAYQLCDFTDLDFIGFHQGTICEIDPAAITDGDQGSDPTYYNSNAVFSNLKRWFSSGCMNGIVAKGSYGSTPTGSPPGSANIPDIVITQNRYGDLDFYGVNGTGIDIVGACDSETFSGKVFIQLAANDAVGIHIASDPDFTGNNYANAFKFDNLIFSLASPALTGCILIKTGWTFALCAHITHDVDVSLVTVLDVDDCQSYHITGQRLLGEHLTLETITKGHRYLAGAGSVTRPHYGFASDLNTGMDLVAPDTIGFSAGGAWGFYVSAFGPVVPQGMSLLFQDSNQSHNLVVTYGSDLTENRTLTVLTADANITFSLQANLTVNANTTIDEFGASLVAAADAAAARSALVAAHATNRAYDEYATAEELAIVIPFDDTTPQNTEGNEILSASITTHSAASRVRILFRGWGSMNSGSVFIAALFIDGEENALQAAAFQFSAGYRMPVGFDFEHAPGAAGTYTYKVRVGANSGPVWMNGNSGSGRELGGASKATLIVEEIF